LGLHKIRPRSHVRDRILAQISFQITEPSWQVAQDLSISEILKMTQIACIEAQLEERIHHVIDQNAGLRTKIVWNFTPFCKPAKGILVDLNSGKSSDRLSKVTAIAFAEMAPLVVCPCFNPISCLP